MYLDGTFRRLLELAIPSILLAPLVVEILYSNFAFLPFELHLLILCVGLKVFSVLYCYIIQRYQKLLHHKCLFVDPIRTKLYLRFTYYIDVKENLISQLSSIYTGHAGNQLPQRISRALRLRVRLRKSRIRHHQPLRHWSRNATSTLMR